MSKKDKIDQTSEDQTVGNAAEPKSKMAFFITPVAQPNSDIRRATDGVIDAVLEPILSKHGFRLVAPHRVSVPGSITKQVIRDILQADLVIANLTGLNANVMYELAVRHAKRLPVITIAQKDTALPFDIHAERTIFYTNDMHGVIELMAELDKTIPLAMAEDQPDNPIYSGIESLLIQQESEKANDPVQNYILKQLEELSTSLKVSTSQKAKITSNSIDRTYSYYFEFSVESKAAFDVKFSNFTELIREFRPELNLYLRNWNMTSNKIMGAFELSPYITPQLLHTYANEAGIQVLRLSELTSNQQI